MDRESLARHSFKAVLFDFDGTLAHLNIDFGRMRSAVHQEMELWGLDPCGLKETYLLEQIHEATQRLGPAAARFCREAHGILRRVEMEAAREGRLLPGVRRLLRGLRRTGIRVGILTRNCREAVMAVAPDLEEYCDAFVPRDGLAHLKPHPGHLLLCLGLLEAMPSTAVMVGDHVIDVRSGSALRMRTIGVLSGNATRQALEEAGADWVVEDVTRLNGLLGLTRDAGKIQ